MQAGWMRVQDPPWLLVVALGAAVWATLVGAAQCETWPSALPGAPPTTDDSERDRRIDDMVFLRLVASPTISACTFRLEVERGVVTLRGVVPTAEAGARALRIAAWTPGVRDVGADLTIDPAVSAPRDTTPPSDRAVAEQVARTLIREIFPSARLHNSWVWGWQIDGGWWGLDVGVDGGHVVLSGSAPKVPEVRRAVESARTVLGVRTVRSLLHVRGRSAGEAVIFSPYGPYLGYDPRPDEPNRPGYGYYGPYPPPRGTALSDYPSAVHPVWRGAADEPTDPWMRERAPTDR